MTGHIFWEASTPFSFLPPLLNLLHSERPKLYTILAFLSAVGLMGIYIRMKEVAPSGDHFEGVCHSRTQIGGHKLFPFVTRTVPVQDSSPDSALPIT